MKERTADQILRKGRMNLLLEYPFWGDLAMHLRLVPTKSLPTLAVDARGNLYYNERFIKEFTTDDCMFEWAHEIGHLMFRHHARKPAGAIHSIWNIACDNIIDTHLIDSGLEQSVVSKKMCPADTQAKLKDTKDGKIMTSEAWYRILVKEMKECPACKEFLEDFEKVSKGQMSEDDMAKKVADAKEKAGEDPNASPDEEAEKTLDGLKKALDSDDDNPGGEAAPDQEYGGHGHEGKFKHAKHICGNVRQCCAGSMGEADADVVEEWKQKIIGAAKAAKMRGNVPACARDFLTDLERPSRDWRDVVRAQCSRIYRGRYTLRRPSRRSHATRVMLPSRMPKPEPAVVAIDASGSIGERTISRFASEVVGILKASGATEVYMFFHDTVVYDEGVFSKEDLKNIKVTFGGTSHRDLWDKLDEMEKPPGILVCFTDMYSDIDSLLPKPYPVIWAHPRGRGNEIDVPFGIKIEVPDDME